MGIPFFCVLVGVSLNTLHAIGGCQVGDVADEHFFARRNSSYIPPRFSWIELSDAVA